MTAPSANAAIAARDLAVVWHPCTQMQDHEQLPLIPIARGEGVWLHDFEGRRYLDGISSWWVNLFGHANPRINAAVIEQLGRLEHVLLAGFTHAPVLELSEALVRLLPQGLTRCFYADNGSSAIEVAVKMSFHYWQNLGRPKKRRFVTLSNSYHGETLGALAVGDVELYKKVYQPLLMDVITVPSPDCHLREPGESWESHSRRMFAEMERTLAAQADEIAAVIVEPLVQCAGSMRMYHPAYLTMLRESCDRHGVLLIADEIAVGFGRTRHALRLRAGGHPAGLHLPLERTHRRLPAALRRRHDRAGVRGVLRRLRETHGVPALAQLHRQSARLRRRARDARHLPRRRRDRAQSHAHRPPRRSGRPARRSSAGRRSPPDGHDRGDRIREGPAERRTLRLARAPRIARL